ncbi:hypothetical protein MTR67_041983 [Solanum verrucosum]|uniref:Uncharacterized protein n=1 Tax=Solanum verrucosum TaxID=315347 RepID=A0AAF0UNC8_SOLVR|nr:hypothetical protein MTR67_041983 [Solanum verrucosum]
MIFYVDNHIVISLLVSAQLGPSVGELDLSGSGRNICLPANILIFPLLSQGEVKSGLIQLLLQ